MEPERNLAYWKGMVNSFEDMVALEPETDWIVLWGLALEYAKRRVRQMEAVLLH